MHCAPVVIGLIWFGIVRRPPHEKALAWNTLAGLINPTLGQSSDRVKLVPADAFQSEPVPNITR